MEVLEQASIHREATEQVISMNRFVLRRILVLNNETKSLERTIILLNLPSKATGRVAYLIYRYWHDDLFYDCDIIPSKTNPNDFSLLRIERLKPNLFIFAIFVALVLCIPDSEQSRKPLALEHTCWDRTWKSSRILAKS